MSESKTDSQHTPGPWEATATSTCSGAWFSIHPSGDPDAEICNTDCFAVNPNSHINAVTIEEDCSAFLDEENADEVRANAHLIAAAPELLGLLLKIVADDCGCHPVCRCDQESALRIWKEEVISEARTLITKAKGAQQ